jgi:hypothetical protein
MNVPRPASRHPLLIAFIGAVGLAVVAFDATGRLYASSRAHEPVSKDDAPSTQTPEEPPFELDLRPGLRRLAVAVDRYERRHGAMPADREALQVDCGVGRELWTCSRCRRPYLLGRARGVRSLAKTWPFRWESTDPDLDTPAAYCLFCWYPDGTTDVLTFDGRIGSMPRSEAIGRSNRAWRRR